MSIPCLWEMLQQNPNWHWIRQVASIGNTVLPQGRGLRLFKSCLGLLCHFIFWLLFHVTTITENNFVVYRGGFPKFMGSSWIIQLFLCTSGIKNGKGFSVLPSLMNIQVALYWKMKKLVHREIIVKVYFSDNQLRVLQTQKKWMEHLHNHRGSYSPFLWTMTGTGLPPLTACLY